MGQERLLPESPAPGAPRPPAMTELDATPTLDPDGSDAARRLMLADLVVRLTAGVVALAGVYAAAAGQAEGDLGRTLEDLARAKDAQAADLAPLARALRVPTPSARPAEPPKSPFAWGVVLGEAFQGERAIERIGRELAVLAAAPPVKVLAARLAAGAARDGKEVRKLYLRYS